MVGGEEVGGQGAEVEDHRVGGGEVGERGEVEGGFGHYWGGAYGQGNVCGEVFDDLRLDEGISRCTLFVR